MQYEHDVFLNYAREDAAAANELADGLRKLDIRVWHDESNLGAGDFWREEIRDAIRKCRFFMPLLTGVSVNKQGFVKTEFEWALKELENRGFHKRRFVLPIVVGSCDIPEAIERFNCIRWTPGNDRWLTYIVRVVKAGESYKEKGFVGFDLGHGDSSIANCLQMDRSNIENLRLHGKIVWPTAIAFVEGQLPPIGFDALRERHFSISFKDTNFEQNRDLLQAYVRRCFEESNDLIRIKSVPKTLVIGCPSGWGDTIRRKYETIFRQIVDDVIDVRVVPESRAALLEAKEKGLLGAVENRDAAVLIIDIGSSTTDYTYVRNLRALPFDSGSLQLGASKIDYALARDLVSKAARSGALPEDSLDVFDNAANRNPEGLSPLLFKCRVIKEEYFSRDERYWKNSSKSAESQVATFNGKQIILNPSYEEFLAALNHPIKGLDNNSWPDFYQHMLEGVQRRIVEKNRQSEGEYPIPSIVLLVGGGANMYFVEDRTRRVFRDADVLFDPACQTYVARGLARCGAIDDSIGDFLADIVHVLDERKLQEIIYKDLDANARQLAERLFLIFKESTISGYDSWRSGWIDTIGDLKKSIHSTFDTERSKDGRISEIAEAWSRSVRQRISELAMEACKRHSLPITEVPDVADPIFDEIPIPNNAAPGDGATVAIALISGVLVFALTSIPFAALGPWGLALRILSGLGATVLTGGFLEDYMAEANINKDLRRLFGSKEKMGKRLDENRAAIIDEMQKKIAAGIRKHVEKENIPKRLEDALKQNALNIATLVEGTERPL